MKTLKKISPYIICSIIVIVIFLTTLKLNNSYPFGPYDIAKFDGFQQYKPMLYNFLMKIKEGIILPYSFNNALGNPTIFNYLYYLASPINLLLLPFNNPNIIYLLCILIKIVISSITATFYGMKKTSNKLISIIIGISYTYSGWFLAYYFHIMWLDAFMIFPLFQYGLEKLINENKSMLYIFTLAYIMISNFYIAFMICLYTFVYYIYNIILKKEKYLYKIKNFQLIMFSTIITMLLCAFHIYATYKSFLKIGIILNDIDEISYNFSIIYFLQSFLSGNTIVNLTPSYTFPNISLNIIFLISFFYYFINNKISKKEKFLNLFVFIFCIILFHSKELNYIMNCFHVPIGFNYRYSFLFSFFIIFLFIRNYTTFNQKIDNKIYLVLLTLAVMIITLKITNTIDFNIFIFNIVFLVIYTTYFIFYSNNKIYKYIFMFLIIIETSLSASINITSNFIIDKNNKDFSNEYIKYRLDTINKYHNENLYSNNNTISAFSSMLYANSLELLYYLGCTTDLKATIYTCNNTPVFNTIFNIKKNNYNYYLEKIYAVNQNISHNNSTENNIYDYQNNLIKSMTNIEKTFIKNEINYNENNYLKTINITEKNTYYIQIIGKFNYAKANNFILVNSSKISPIYENSIYEISSKNYQIIKELKENDTIDIYFEEGQTPPEVYVYTLDKEKYKQAYDYLNKNQINYTKYTDSHIKGTINVDKNQLIFTSIPYDESWEIKIDGKKVKPIMLLNSVIGIECEPGEHTISMQYKSNYKIPIIISITTLISLITYIIVSKLKHKKNA